MELKYATEWVERRYGSDIAAYHGRIFGIEILTIIIKKLEPFGGQNCNNKSPINFTSLQGMVNGMEVLPYSHLLMRSQSGDVELLLEPEKNEFTDYTCNDTFVCQYRSAVKIKGEEKTLEQLAGVLEEYKNQKVK